MCIPELAAHINPHSDLKKNVGFLLMPLPYHLLTMAKMLKCEGDQHQEDGQRCLSDINVPYGFYAGKKSNITSHPYPQIRGKYGAIPC
jgi:hypothetical protein